MREKLQLHALTDARRPRRRRRHRRRLGGPSRRERRRRDASTTPQPEAERRVARDARERRARLGTSDARAARPRSRSSFVASLAGRRRATPTSCRRARPRTRRSSAGCWRRSTSALEPDALVCSSTSGLLPSRLQADMERPERFVVGHPFNPVYLLPLVEVVAGEQTSENRRARARRLLRVARHEAPPRAQARSTASWPTACSRRCGARRCGSCTTTSRRSRRSTTRSGSAPGLRWAQMGTFLTYRIAGGEDGMRHFLEQFGPALAVAVDEADRRAGADGRADRQDRRAVRRAGGRALGTRARAHPRRQPRRDPAGAARARATGPGACSRAHEREAVRRARTGTCRRRIRRRPLRLHRRPSIRRGSTTTAT